MEPSISAKQKEIAVISDCARKSTREQLRLGDDRSLSRRGQVLFVVANTFLNGATCQAW